MTKEEDEAQMPKTKMGAEQVLEDIRRKTQRHFSAKDKNKIVLEGLRGNDAIAEVCREEGIADLCITLGSRSS